MKILVTNDDSVSAAQLLPLIRWCQTIGEVTTVVPKFEQSGKSHGIEIHKPFEVQRIELEPGIWVYTVDSSPADCVRYALYSLNEKFDLVVSGVNRGYNLGCDITYSGTVGAVEEAGFWGVPAIALSTSPSNYDHATDELDRVYAFLRKHRLLEQHSLFNINLPPEPKGIRITRQGGRYYGDRFIPEEGNMVRPMGVCVYQNQGDLGIDSDAIAAGYISVMPLSPTRADLQVFSRLADLTE